MSKKLIPAFVLTSVLAGLMATPASAAEVIRHKLPNSDFPISLAVEIPPGVTVVNLSGVVPPLFTGKPARGRPLSGVPPRLSPGGGIQ